MLVSKNEWYNMNEMVMNKWIWVTVLCLAVAACGTGKSSKGQQVKGKAVATLTAFPYPEVPAVMTEPEERLAYLVEHFWERYDFRDTALLQRREITEQGFADFVGLLSQAQDRALWQRAMKPFAEGAAETAEAYRCFGELAELYLYDPNSPMRDEELFLAFVAEFMKQRVRDEGVYARLEFQRDLALKNRVGQAAADFRYVLADGKEGSLRSTAKGKPLLLVFHDPDCVQCRETMAFLEESAVLAEAVKAGKVAVLAVYTEGYEEVWQAHKDELPAGWISANDHAAVKTQLLYDLKAMPTLYLLDGEHRVALKDAAPGAVLQAVGGL